MSVGPAIPLRLPFRAPLLPDNLFGHLSATAIPGVEEWRDGAYRRTVRLTRGCGIVALRPPVGTQSVVEGRLRLTDAADQAEAVQLCRRVLDLDADPSRIDAALAKDAVLAPLVRAAPGRRVPRTVNSAEMAVRAVLGQQVSTAAARTHAARLVVAHGESVDDPDGGLTALFPTVEALLDLDPQGLALPEKRKRTLLGLLAAIAGGSVDLDGDAQRARTHLLALPGIGPWTVETLAMRAFGDPDAFLVGDLGVRMAAGKLGLPTAPAALEQRSHRWRPWRAYAVQHLWATGEHAVNRLPP